MGTSSVLGKPVSSQLQSMHGATLVVGSCGGTRDAAARDLFSTHALSLGGIHHVGVRDRSKTVRPQRAGDYSSLRRRNPRVRPPRVWRFWRSGVVDNLPWPSTHVTRSRLLPWFSHQYVTREWHGNSVRALFRRFLHLWSPYPTSPAQSARSATYRIGEPDSYGSFQSLMRSGRFSTLTGRKHSNNSSRRRRSILSIARQNPWSSPLIA
jgi:hypothetical protein